MNAAIIPFDAKARTVADHLGLNVIEKPAPEPVNCSLSQLVRKLESHLGADRWTLQKVRTGDYEVRVYAPERGPLKSRHGQVGRGSTATDAIADLVSQLGSVTYEVA